MRPYLKVSLVLRSFVIAAAVVAVAMAQSAGSFTSTGGMTTPRAAHTATLLANGQVLIAGGFQQAIPSTILASAELYDPATGKFTPTGSMTASRAGHSAVLLADGKVLIAAGRNATEDLVAAELYDPSTGTFASIGSMPAALDGLQIAALLADGRVLLTGCAIPCNSAIAELYDPVAGTFAVTGVPSAAGTPTLLADGQVLVAGGDCASDGSTAAQLFDPATGVFSFTGRLPKACDDINTATLLANGKVLFEGNEENDGFPADAELYDPVAGAFTSLGHAIGPHEFSAATLLPDGTALITGGQSPGGNGEVMSEFYAPASGTFSVTATMTTGRHEHTSTLLPDGTVLIAGGFSIWPSPTSTAELYRPPALVSAPSLFSLSGDGQGRAAIWDAITGQIISASNPAGAGQALSMYTTNLIEAGLIPPQIAIGGHLAQILYFGDAPGYPGYFQVNFRMPGGVAPGSAVPVRLTYLGRSSNVVTIGAQ